MAFAAIFFGLILFLFGGTNYYRVRVLSFNSVPREVQNENDEEFPVEVMIPSLNIDLTVEPGNIKEGVWEISPDKATFLSSSAVPGTGNTVIYGHNKKAILGNLPYVGNNQEIILKTKSGKLLTYKVTKKYWVDPSRVDLVSPSDTEELTLYTCTGFADSKRFVVKALPVE